MSRRRLAWTAALVALVASPEIAPAGDPLAGGLPPPGARPEPAGRPVGYHQRNYGGCKQGTLPAIWSDLDEVYRKEMHNVFTYKAWKWRYGYPVGYGIGADCQGGGAFGTTERCGLAPLHYRAEAPTVFAGSKPGLTGASWYRLTPSPAADAPVPAPAMPVPVPAPAPLPGGGTGHGSSLNR